MSLSLVVYIFYALCNQVIYAYVKRVTTLIICDMIKGNESDVENIDFELQA